MNDLRRLQFDDLSAAVADARALLVSGYDRRGTWSLGQICRHLVLVQDPSVDGYPKWMSLFAFLRPVLRRWLLPELLSENSPRGIRTSSTFMPEDDCEDAKEVARFAESVDRLLKFDGDYFPHPAFGRLTRDKILQIHCAHAAHHLRFLIPKE